jgi:hypothetical protein
LSVGRSTGACIEAWWNALTFVANAEFVHPGFNPVHDVDPAEPSKSALQVRLGVGRP